MQYIYLIVSIIFNLSGNFFAKNASNGEILQKYILSMNLNAILSISSFIISMILFTKSLSNLRLDVAQPIQSVVCIVGVTFISALYYHTSVNTTQILGILFSIVGIILIVTASGVSN